MEPPLQASPLHVATTTGVLALLLVLAASAWRLLEWVDEPGWAAIVPGYNLAVLARAAHLSPWWSVAMLVPWLGLGVLALALYRLARRLGCTTPLGVAMAIAPFVVMPLVALALGSRDDRPGLAPRGPRHPGHPASDP